MVYMLSKQQHTLLSPSTTSLRASPAIPPSPKRASSRRTVHPVRAIAAAAGDGEVPSPEKRKTMNIILAGGTSLPAVSMLGPFLKFFYPPSEGGAGGSQRAKDIQGVDIKLTGWLQSHPQPGARDLAQGLRGDPTYIITNSEGTGIENFGINSICTHLGCVVPWQGAENKFICPCHGSQYDPAGKVVRGPAPLSLALAHTDVQDDGQIMFSAWEETDFRDNSTPWWK